MNWTEQQLKVIQTHGRDLLVSAAAGSGKTAVLVERIIRMITDPEKPVRIDELLVVTFTRAAAAEMKERIRQALESLAKQQPEDENIQRQLAHIHHARIMTIDSFCSRVVRDHFEQIDIDPNYRIGDEVEIAMMQEDVLTQMLEDCFEQGDEDFMSLAQQYTSAKMKDSLGELIRSLNHQALAHYNPTKWLQKSMQIYQVSSAEELAESNLVKDFLAHYQKILSDMADSLEHAVEMLDRYEEKKAAENLEKVLSIVKNAEKAEDYETLRRELEPIEKTIQVRTGKKFPEEFKQYIKELKSSVVDFCKKKMLQDAFSQSFEQIYSDIHKSRKTVETIVRLTLEFMERYEKLKLEKGVIDFQDQEHLALRILNDETECGTLIPSSVAKNLSERFKEIMIDEYQDSNEIQEYILSSISKGGNSPKMFMVGDVKQSIYRFRQAEPKLFLDKFNRFSEDLTKEQCKITLDRNFRSRREVIESVNFLFDYLMHPQLGGIDYQKDNRLALGADFGKAPNKQDHRSELIMIRSETREEEAEYVAQKILEITNPDTGMKITKDGEYRPVRYGDIAILLRSVKGVSDVYQEHLENHGVPVYAENRTGFYETIEIRTMLDFLSVIDNARQDIPLAATMSNPMFGFTSEELAVIQSASVSNCLFEAVNRYGIDGTNQNLVQKTNQFLQILFEFRDMTPYTGVYDLIQLILQRTGYEYYLRAMVNGTRRIRNLEMLKTKAVAYDETSYKGLFNFVRYVQRIKEMESDEGESALQGEEENVVKIMTIHKSKGLQFPIVFVCDCARKMREFPDKIVMNDQGELGIDCIDPILGTQAETLYKKAIRLENRREAVAEELRILYVALTRAEEKLFMTARSRKMEEKVLTFRANRLSQNRVLSYARLMESPSFFDWIGYTVGRNKAFAAVAGEPAYEMPEENGIYHAESNFKAALIDQEEILQQEIEKNAEYMEQKEWLWMLGQRTLSTEKKRELEELLHFRYPYQEYVSKFAKASVTEIKKQSMAYVEELDGFAVFGETAEPPLKERIPFFMQEDRSKEQKLTGAERGTAYHRVLELLDLNVEEYTREQVVLMLEDLVSHGLMEQAQADCIRPEEIVKFTKSSLFHRMKQAQERKELFRERKFLLGIGGQTAQNNSEDMMIVQGIIDVCFIEDGKYVLADYKTDRVQKMSELVEKYHVQLESYKQALEQISKIPVSEMIIYSIELQDEITIS